MTPEQIAAKMREAMAATPDRSAEYQYAIGRIRAFVMSPFLTSDQRVTGIRDVLAALDLAHGLGGKR